MSKSADSSPTALQITLPPRSGRSRPGSRPGSRPNSRPGSRQGSPAGRATPQVGLTPLTTRSTSQTRLNLKDGGIAALQAEVIDDGTLTITQQSSGQLSPTTQDGSESPESDKATQRSRTISVRFAPGGSHNTSETGLSTPASGSGQDASPSPLTGKRRVPQEPKLVTSADELLSDGIAEYTFVPDGLLGKGKFSQVRLAVKDGQKYAIKHTPLHPHHELVATRLLREPNILAQLPPHPNLVKVYETIRTPGHFYLVEECLDDYLSLEAFVAKSPKGKLQPDAAKSVLDQLVSVVRDAIHRPIHVCHRDIKPEKCVIVTQACGTSPDGVVAISVLIHPDTLHVVLLDFGLATHFAASEPKLTTCCGSPAFHSPELFTSLRSPPGSVRYRGPEIDAWTVGVTLLRCCLGIKYPLGIAHANIDALANKTADACLAVEDRGLRRALAGLLDMDGEKRMQALLEYKVPLEIREAANAAMAKRDREFKSTTFLPTPVKHRLDVRLLSVQRANPSAAPSSTLAHEIGAPAPEAPSPRPSLDTRTRLAELILQNPTQEPFARIVSFVKYTLRCAGILYHCLDEPNRIVSESVPSTPLASPCLSHDPILGERKSRDPKRRWADEDDIPYVKILQCVLHVPKSDSESRAATALKTHLRPQLLRARTAGPGPARSSSTPPGKASRAMVKEEAAKVTCLPFWLAISIRDCSTPASTNEADVRKKAKPKRRRHTLSSISITLSDTRALDAVEAALSVPSHDQSSRDASEPDGSARPNGTIDLDAVGSLERGRSSRKERPKSALVRSATADSTFRSPTRREETTPSTDANAASRQPEAKTRTDVPRVAGGFFDFAPALMRALKGHDSPASSVDSAAAGRTDGEGPSKPSTNNIAGMAAPMF